MVCMLALVMFVGCLMVGYWLVGRRMVAWLVTSVAGWFVGCDDWWLYGWLVCCSNVFKVVEEFMVCW